MKTEFNEILERLQEERKLYEDRFSMAIVWAIMEKVSTDLPPITVEFNITTPNRHFQTRLIDLSDELHILHKVNKILFDNFKLVAYYQINNTFLVKPAEEKVPTTEELIFHYCGNTNFISQLRESIGIHKKLKMDENHPVMSIIHWLGLFATEAILKEYGMHLEITKDAHYLVNDL